MVGYGYIINSDDKWFKKFENEARNDGWIVHFQISGRQPASIVDAGTYLFHRVKNTNKIKGYGIITEIGYFTLEKAIENFGIEKLGYSTEDSLLTRARRWQQTHIDYELFYEVEENLQLCNLDLNLDLQDNLNIRFGTPPSHLPTVGKSLEPYEFQKLLNYIGVQDNESSN